VLSSVEVGRAMEGVESLRVEPILSFYPLPNPLSFDRLRTPPAREREYSIKKHTPLVLHDRWITLKDLE